MMAAEGDRTKFRTILEDIVEASKLPAKRRPADVKPKAVDLGSLAYERGVLPDDLDVLIDLITAKSHLDQASLNNIIRNLYPVGRVSEDVVFRIVGCLGLGELKPPLTIQSQLLQWIILVYNVLDTKAQAALSRSYGVLFNLLDVSATRPQLFHILALITRRKHVQHYRIQALLNLTRLSAKDGHLQGLLRVYRNYYPEIILGTVGKSSTFKLPDPEWRERLSVIQRLHREQQASNSQGPQDGFRVNQQLLNQYKGGKSAAIPPVQTSNAHEKSITLEEIDSAESLALNLEKIELPDHLVAVLADPLLQKLMVLKRGNDMKRASAWITTQIGEALNGDTDEEIVINTLRIILAFARSTKSISHIFPALVKLIKQRAFLNLTVSPVREILTYHPLMDWKELSAFTTFLEATPGGVFSSLLDLLDLYTKLLQRWTISLLSQDDVPRPVARSVAELIEHVNKLCLTLTQSSPTENTCLRVLDFYEQVAYIFSKPKLVKHIFVTIPPAALVYTLLFSQSLATVSRLCGILAVYKEAFATTMSYSSKRQGPGYDKEHVEIFNGFLMDICNCIWRGKALVKSDPTAQNCMVADRVVESLTRYVGTLEDGLALGTLFNISYSPLLCLQSIEHVRQLEDAEDEEVELRARHAGPVTQQSLTLLARKGGLELTWQDYRMGLLRRLEDRGLIGIPELLYCTMKSLRDSRMKT